MNSKPSAIWQKQYSLDQLKQHNRNTLVEHLGIELIEVGPDYLTGTMPVDSRTHQPIGILHGGASVVLAETLGSTAGNLAAPAGQYCVGLDINANHLAKVRSGLVTGIAKPQHLGRSTQVWEILIRDENERLTCVSRLTLAVLKSVPKPASEQNASD